MTNVKDAGREGGGLNIWADPEKKKFQKCSKWLEKDFETWFFFGANWAYMGRRRPTRELEHDLLKLAFCEFQVFGTL